MGSDFCFEVVSFCGDMRDEDRKKAMLKALEECPLDPDVWAEYIERTCLDFTEDDQADIKKDAQMAIIEFFDSFGCRDVGELSVYDRNIVISGGMSWGDAPTDSYDLFGKICCLPNMILDAGLINMPNDASVPFFKQYGEFMPKELKDRIEKHIQDHKILKRI